MTTTETITLAGGCFWCTEAVFQRVRGVVAVQSGYCNGHVPQPSYEQVCTGTTGHAEAVRVRFDPQRISYPQLLQVFFSVAHDPTQLDRQGPDVGTQYRSAIFATSPAQLEVARAYVAQLDAAKLFGKPIVTRLEDKPSFFPAETYHQDYAARNPAQPYIAAVAAPKVAKLRKQFAPMLKDRATHS